MGVDKSLFYTTSFLISVGIAFSLSLSVYTTLYFDVPVYHFFIRQFCVGMACIFIIWLLSRFDASKQILGGLTAFEIVGFMLFIGSFIAMAIMEILPSSLVPLTGGARRWIRLGPVSLAPVEFFKIGFVFFLSWSFNRKLDRSKRGIKEEFTLLIPYFALFGIAVFFILILQKDFGQIFLLVLTLIILSTFAGASKRLFVLVGAVLSAILAIAIIMQPHRIRRLEGWWVTNQDFILSFLPTEYAKLFYLENAQEPYQITHSLNAMYHGGIFGTGLGGGTFKLGFLSEVHTDFVLSGMSEEIGFVGILFLTCALIWVIFRILKISSRSENNVYHLFCLGVATVMSVAFLMNAYGVTSITPVKGIAVPFLSYGGSSLLALSFGIGMVLMVSKKANLS